MAYEQTLAAVRALSEKYPDPVKVAREREKSALTHWLRNGPWRPATGLTEAQVVQVLEQLPTGGPR